MFSVNKIVVKEGNRRLNAVFTLFGGLLVVESLFRDISRCSSLDDVIKDFLETPTLLFLKHYVKTLPTHLLVIFLMNSKIRVSKSRDFILVKTILHFKICSVIAIRLEQRNLNNLKSSAVKIHLVIWKRKLPAEIFSVCNVNWKVLHCKIFRE